MKTTTTRQQILYVLIASCDIQEFLDVSYETACTLLLKAVKTRKTTLAKLYAEYCDTVYNADFFNNFKLPLIQACIAEKNRITTKSKVCKLARKFCKLLSMNQASAMRHAWELVKNGTTELDTLIQDFFAIGYYKVAYDCQVMLHIAKQVLTEG